MNGKTPHPPKWATGFLSWYCRPELLEDLEGDLNEYFHRNLKERGATAARLIYADHDRIYRVVIATTNSNGSQGIGASMCPPLGTDLRRETTGFSAVTTLYSDDTRVLVPIAGKPLRIIPANSEGEPQHPPHGGFRAFYAFPRFPPCNFRTIS